MHVPLRILMVEDNPDDALLVLRKLRKSEYDISSQRVETAADFAQALQSTSWDVVIADYALPQFSAPAALELMRSLEVDLPFIIVSGTIEEEMAVTALKAGAHDFITKGNLSRLPTALDRELREANERQRRKQAEASLIHHARRIEVLLRISSRLNQTLDLDESVRTICYEARTAFDAKAAGVLFFNQSTDCFELVHAEGISLEQMSHFPDLPRSHIHDSVELFNDLHDLRIDDPMIGYLHELGIDGLYTAQLRCKGQLIGMLVITTPLQSGFGYQDNLALLQGLADQAAIALDNALLFRDLHESYDATLEGWVHALDLKDKETEGHAQRVTELTMMLARAMGIGEAELVHVRRGALLHDIGKMGVPDAVLLKPGRLTPEEWVIMKKHPVYAYEWLRPIAFLEPALEIPYCHHERMDGSGYPRGLKGEEIPLTARMFAVVDVWDAMRSDRPYHAARSVEEVRAYLLEESGRLFDAEVVHAFLQIVAAREDDRIIGA